MDAIDPAVVDAAETALAHTPSVAEVESVKVRWVGHRVRAEAGITVDPALIVTQAHAIAIEAHHRLLHDVPKLVEATVHVSPEGPTGEQQHALVAHHRPVPPAAEPQQ